MKPERTPTFGEQIVLYWGKVRRWYYHTLRPGYIARNHRRRRGECSRCGICCFMGCLCHHYREDAEDNAMCDRHTIRPRNCRIYPIDERDLADRDILAPDTPCGYSFLSEEEVAAEAAASTDSAEAVPAAEAPAASAPDVGSSAPSDSG